MAAKKGHRRSIKELLSFIEKLENSSDIINHQDSQGNTALHYVTKLGNLKALELILKMKPDIKKNNEGNTPSHIAASFASKHLSCLKTLLKYTNFKDPGENIQKLSLLAIAIQKQAKQTLEYLLTIETFKNQLNHQGKFGQTILHNAIKRGWIEGVECLLSQPGIDVGIADDNYDLPIHLAASKKMDRRICHKLLRGGLYLKAKNRMGNFLFFY